MKTCMTCGTSCPDSSVTCPTCGARLPASAAPATGRKRSLGGTGASSKLPLILLAGLLVVALIVGAVALIMQLSPKTTLMNATYRSGRSLLSAVDDNTGLVSTVNTMKKQGARGEYSAELSLDYSGGDVRVTANYNMSQLRKVANGNFALSLPKQGLDISMPFSLDRRSVQFSLPGNSVNIYGVQMKDTSKIFDALAMSPTDGAKSLEKQLRADLKELFKSVEVTKLEKRDLMVNGTRMTCRVYRVEWSRQLSEKLIKEMDQYPFLSGLEEQVRKLAGSLDNSMLCYVDKSGRLIGLDLSFAGSQYLFLLEGGKSPWDCFSLTQRSLVGQDHRFEGGMEQVGNTASIYLKDASGDLFRTSYDLSSGRFQLGTRSLGTVLEGKILSGNGSGTLGLDMFSGTDNALNVEFRLGKINDRPEVLSKHYIDLVTEKFRFAIDLKNALGLDLDDVLQILKELGVNV